MAKFRKRPVIIEAVQYRPGLQHPGVAILRRQKPDGTLDCAASVVTIHDQVAWVENGDWLIAEPDGIHFYPCKDDIFKMTYDPVLETAAP